MNPTKATLRRFKTLPCARCGALGEENTVDHVIPKAMLRCFGLMDVGKENYQPLCQKCNALKGQVLDPMNEQTWKLLDRYVSRWKNLHRKVAPRRTYAFRNIEVQSDYLMTTWGV